MVRHLPPTLCPEERDAGRQRLGLEVFPATACPQGVHSRVLQHEQGVHILPTLCRGQRLLQLRLLPPPRLQAVLFLVVIWEILNSCHSQPDTPNFCRKFSEVGIRPREFQCLGGPPKKHTIF